jgi:hypothetical protein
MSLKASVALVKNQNRDKMVVRKALLDPPCSQPFFSFAPLDGAIFSPV